MKTECSYIIIQPHSITIIEGWSSSQFRYLGITMRTVCWFLSLLCWSGHKYPRNNFVLNQMFKDLCIDNIKRAIIQVRRNPRDETNTYRTLYVTRFDNILVSSVHK